MQIRHRLFTGAIGLVLLGSCTGLAPKIYDEKDFKVNDPTLDLTRKDYRDLPMVNPKHMGNSADYAGFETTISGGTGEPPIPKIAPILSAPKPPKLGKTKLVSLAVTDDVPLKDVLLELARLADVDIEVDANIQGGIAFRATQKPFNEVIERIADFANLRYSMNNGVLRVERDDPYVQIYTLDFLNFERTASSTVSVSTSVLSSGGSGEGGGLSTGSSTNISTSSDNDFWEQFEEGISRILAYAPQQRASQSSPTQFQSIDPVPTSTDGTVEEALNASPTPETESSGTEGEAAAATATAAASSENTGPYTINRQASTLTVVASERQHRLVAEFIRTLEYNASAQVLIEAKIVEVTLNEDFENGIDWSRFGGSSITASSLFGGVTDPTNLASFDFSKQNLTGLDIDITAAVEMTQIFGTTRTLSSPRLHAINNQQAVLTFAQNEVYFEIEVEKEEEDTGVTTQDTITVNSTIKTVPIGIIMTILPSINRRTGEVTLNIRPTLSRVVDRVEDPGLALSLALDPALAALNVTNLIPVVEARELDSIMKVKSGEVMVIGGLMEDKGIQAERGVPGASDVPVLGHLFKATDRERETKELIIFIRATILDENGYHHPADKRLYEKFTQDPRPLEF